MAYVRIETNRVIRNFRTRTGGLVSMPVDRAFSRPTTCNWTDDRKPEKLGRGDLAYGGRHC